jgi:hypothetical protein
MCHTMLQTTTKLVELTKKKSEIWCILFTFHVENPCDIWTNWNDIIVKSQKKHCSRHQFVRLQCSDKKKLILLYTFFAFTNQHLIFFNYLNMISQQFIFFLTVASNFYYNLWSVDPKIKINFFTYQLSLLFWWSFFVSSVKKI